MSLYIGNINPFFILTLIIIVIGIFYIVPEDTKPKYNYKYNYKRHNWLLTKAEREFYEVLIQVVEQDYIVFTQVRLSALFDHKVEGQNWNAAFRHISQKSVDFVLCDKEDISPKLAIELDDRSHERFDRQNRDIEVERIFKQAGMPLLRIQNSGVFNPQEIAEKIKLSINPNP
jgi:very-short-patch-repair endonuclease